MNVFKIMKSYLYHIRFLLQEDLRIYKQLSDYVFAKDERAKLCKSIIVESHVIEKGLSHKNIRMDFGKSTVLDLYNNVSKYSKYAKYDPYVLNTGILALMEYIRVNTELGSEFVNSLKLPDGLSPSTIFKVGANEVDSNVLFDYSNSTYDAFAKGRKSIRLYDSKSTEIQIDRIIEAIHLAQTAPSACNRQGTRVYVIKNRDLMSNILKIQGGSRGFGENGDSIILITEDMNYYSTTDVRLANFDAGLFTMSLLNSLYFYKIGTCTLNGTFSEAQTKELRQIFQYPSNELLTGIILLSQPAIDSSVMIANSSRRGTRSIMRIVE